MSAMFALTLAHLAMLPATFDIEAYLGVLSILTVGMAITSTIALWYGDSTGVWVFALLQGLLSAAGYLLTRLVRMPFAGEYSFHRWSHPPALAVALLGTAVAGLAVWRLHGRWGLPPTCTTVTCARERDLLLRASRGYAQAPQPEPAPVRKGSANSSTIALRATPRRFVIFRGRDRGRHPRRSPAGSVARHVDR
ncbi:hypothetical protein ACRYCC_06945 [Actinomadura scrupuli]|uniref:hypothetical protein n=1 Tax=Actinomadura scrupuli TaxID=559629 RepID=UPI003D99A9BB